MRAPLLFIVALGALVAGCQAPLLKTSSSSSRNLELTFLISGTSTTTPSGSSATASGSRLLLATARSLTVTLTLQGAAAATATQTVALAGDATQATLLFPNTPVGLYTVAAQAFNAEGTVTFEQTGTADLLTFGDPTVVLNLVPTEASLAGDLAPAGTYEGSMEAGASKSWRVPASALVGSLSVVFSTGDPSLLCFVQGADGRQLNADPTARNIEVAVDAGEYAFVTLYNSSTALQGYLFVLNTPGSVDVSVTTDGTYQSLVFSPSALTVSAGLPVTLAAGFGGTDWNWTVSPSVSGASAGSAFTFTPPSPGTYTVSASVTGSDGIYYSGSLVVTANQVPITGLLLSLFTRDSGTSTITDASTYRTNGTVTGTVTPTTDGSGNTAYHFDSGATVATTSAQTQLSYDHDFSYSLWFSVDALGVTGYPPIVGQKTSGGNQFGFLTCVSGTSLKVQLNDSGVGSKEVAVPLTAETTYHLLVVYTATNTTETVYLNGAPVGTVAYSDTAAAPGGAGLSFGGTGFAGTIGRFRMYDRALSADEVTVLYQE
jgi:hypothetical protein